MTNPQPDASLLKREAITWLLVALLAVGLFTCMLFMDFGIAKKRPFDLAGYTIMVVLTTIIWIQGIVAFTIFLKTRRKAKEQKDN